MQTFCVDDNIDERKAPFGSLQSIYWGKQQLSFIVLPTMDCMFRSICHGLSCALRRAENKYIDCVEEKINIKENIIQEYKYYQHLKEKKINREAEK